VEYVESKIVSISSKLKSAFGYFGVTGVTKDMGRKVGAAVPLLG